MKFNSLFFFLFSFFFFFFDKLCTKNTTLLTAFLAIILIWKKQKEPFFFREMKAKQWIPFYSFFSQARRICFGLKNCFSFMLSCQLVLSAMMLLSSCVLLPPPLTGLHLLWLSCLIVPLLSLSLIGSPSDPNLMTMMTGKNDKNFKVTFNYSWLLSVLVCRVRLWYLR